MVESYPVAWSFDLPPWLIAYTEGLAERTFTSDRDKMAIAVEASRRNVEEGTGGPFGAAVFDAHRGSLTAVGVNLVTEWGTSVAHAEMVALLLAQRRLGTYDLGQGGRAHELFSSTDPCSMCLGAVPWSGVRRLVCAAREEDALAIGFDEGPKPVRWEGELARRGIEVERELLRAEARAVLTAYARAGGVIYNGREGERPG